MAFGHDRERRNEFVDGSPWADRRSLLLLAPLIAAFLLLLPWLPWRSNFDVDSLTWCEQVRSVAQTGSVGFVNVVAPETNSESATRWFVAAHGRIWGIYPAPLTYLLAPAMRLGGFRGVIRLLWIFELAAALFTYATVHRLTGRRFLAVGTAYALALGTSWVMWATAILPFVPAGAFLAMALYARIRAAVSSSARGAMYAALAGLAASLALGSHVMAVASWAGVGATFALVGRWRDRAAQGLAFLVASAPAIALMSWVNHLRFGTWSPLSYGPCNSQNCAGAGGQSLERFMPVLKLAGPRALFLIAAVWCARRSRLALCAVTALAVLFACIPELGGPVSLHPVARTLYGYIVDLGMLNLSGLHRAPNGIGNMNGGWNLRAWLQCTPVFAASVMALAHLDRHHPRRAERLAGVAAATAVCVGLFFVGALRAHEPETAPWGTPFLNLRYLTMLAPCAMALSAVGLERLPWRRWHLALWVLPALAGVAWLSVVRDETHHMRRFATHVWPLEFAVWLLALLGAGHHLSRESSTTVWVRLARHGATVLAALCLAYGSAITLGVDRVAALSVRGRQDARTAELLRVPEREFMLLGGYAMDEALAAHDERAIHFVNLGMDPNGHPRSEARARRWIADGGAVYLIQDAPDGPWHPPWRGLRLTPVPGTRCVFRVSL